MVLLVVSPFLLFSAPVYSQPSWPTSWIQIDTDKNENGTADDWRDVKKAYYQYDSSYLYLKLQCRNIPGSQWAVSPDGDARYKWFIDLEGNLYPSGGSIYDAEYLLFVEDTDDDASGEMYLLYDTNGDNNFGEYEPWDSANHTNYEVTNSSVGDWRIVSDQIEMYISWNSIGNPTSYWMFWATDQENNNLDQGPTTDRMDEDQPIQGVVPGLFTLTVNIVGSGSVTKDPDQLTYTNGTVVTLTAVPDAGWAFSDWSGDLVSINNPDTITMDDNKTVTATFTQIQYTLTVNIVGGGSVSKNPDQATYTYGTVVTLTATPNLGWTFSYWSGDASGTVSPTTVTMDGDKTVTAIFATAPTPPSPGVGGYAVPINIDIDASNSLFPQIGLVSVLLAAMAVAITLTRRRKKTLKRKH